MLTSEQQVSYRTLSRALRVHANRAKQMLYDFHTTQNKKKPESLHATYLITGFQSVSPPQPEDDVPDQFSPAHQEPTSYRATSLLLVDQDNLDGQSSPSSTHPTCLFADHMSCSRKVHVRPTRVYTCLQPAAHQDQCTDRSLVFCFKSQPLTPHRICMS